MEILESHDLSDFDRLYRAHFINEFPIPGARNIPAARVVKDRDGNVVASGFIKLLTEAVIVTDQGRSRLDRVKAIDLLLTDMIDWCAKHEVDQVHAFVNDKFARVLNRHYDFQAIKAVALVRNI